MLQVPRRNSFGAWSELRCGGVTAARCSAPSRGRAERLGFWRGCCGWEQGGPRGGLKRAPGSRCARSRRKPAGFSGGDHGWPLRGRERWGRRPGQAGPGGKRKRGSGERGRGVGRPAGREEMGRAGASARAGPR